MWKAAFVTLCLVVVGCDIPDAPKPGPNQRHELRAPNNKDVPAARDADSLNRMMKLVQANDIVGLTQLESSGSIFTVPSGTEVKVISPGLFTSETRIANGNRAGQIAFVAADFVKPITTAR